MDALEPPQLFSLVRWLKDGPAGVIPITSAGLSWGGLRAVTWEDAGDLLVHERLLSWHSSTFSAIAIPLQLTFPAVRRWLIQQVLETPDRLLFWVRNVSGSVIGHVGIGGFDFARRTVGIRDIVCGERGAEALMNQAVAVLDEWVRESFRFRAVALALDRIAA